MKKGLGFCLVLLLVFGLATIGSAATKKATAKAPGTTAPAVVAPAPIPAAPVSASAPAKMGLFFEGGFGGGALLVSAGYAKPINDKLTYNGEIGYGVGSSYGVLVLDLARLKYDMKSFFIGGGLSYAMYSKKVEIPGPGVLSSNNLVGVEILGGKAVNETMTAVVAYNTALGIRASISMSR